MAYDERLDGNSGYYRGWQAAVKTVLDLMEKNDFSREDIMIFRSNLNMKHELWRMRLQDPMWRRKLLKASLTLLDGGKQ